MLDVKKDNSRGKCPERSPLKDRDLLGMEKAEALESLFRLLGNSTRLRILHALIKADELCVCELAREIDMQHQAVSNQLRHLAARDVVQSRRAGNNIFYKVVDDCITTILCSGLCQLDCAKNRS